jgi:2-dehydro-3-deoxygluconokinase
MWDALVIGECMVELSLEDGRGAAIGYAGDTFNTAVYLARLGVPTAYGTAVGDEDPFSAGILALMDAEGVGRDLVVEARGRLPGLYAIQRDGRGERSFFYWRDPAPARDYMELADGEALQAAMDAAKLVYVSAITLAILGEACREALHGRMLHAARAGADLVLDTNYRARLWPDPATACAAIEALAPHCRIVSTGEQDLAGLGLEQKEARRWAAAGAEVIFRQENRDIWIFAGEDSALTTAEPAIAAVDTTGAGDAFNAGYLAARLAGRPPVEAAAEGRRLAGTVVQHRGAIISRSAMPRD